MRMKKVFAIFLSIIMFCTLLVACTGAKGTNAGGVISFTDMAGREITLPSAAQRVVAVDAADCEILYAVGAGGTLVGRGTYCDYPAEATDISVIESGEGLNTEQIIALEPDVVIMAIMAQTKEQVEAIERAGITVVATAATDINGVYEAIKLIGNVCGKQNEAEALVLSMQNTFARLEADAAGKAGGSIYFEVSPLEYGLWAAGRGTFMNEIAAMLNLDNIFEEVDGWAQISTEQVIERNPSYIITTGMYFGEGLTPSEEIYSREGWQGITALQSGNIYNADANTITRPGPRLALAAEELYDFVYGN